METTAVPAGDTWRINGTKRFNSGLHDATHDMVFARTSGEPGDAEGITCFIVPTDTPGFRVRDALVDAQYWAAPTPEAA